MVNAPWGSINRLIGKGYLPLFCPVILRVAVVDFAGLWLGSRVVFDPNPTPRGEGLLKGKSTPSAQACRGMMAVVFDI